jgi:beta-glucanase (GH16 family)
MQVEVSGHGSEQTQPQQHSNGSVRPDFVAERAELEWVLAQPEISRSNNLVRFLTFICSKYFEGAVHDIREQTIATEALGRKLSNFDSHADPIVRVTARTLRKKLETIYSTDGQLRHLQIVLPVGHYVPKFLERPEIVERVPEEAEDPDQKAATTELVEETLPGPFTPALPLASAQAPLWKRFWKPTIAAIAVPALFLGGYMVGRRDIQPSRSALEGLKWGAPVWSDEFDGSAQQFADPAKWTYVLEAVDSPGSKDRQVYCSPRGGLRDCDPRHPNAFLDGMGHLVLRAEKNGSGVWTLTRMTTKGLKNFEYGRIEARIKMPVGAGLWPSFVMVGANKDSVGWPESGSIDIAENVSMSASSNGLGPTMIRSTLHGPRYFGSNGLWHDFRLPNGGRIDDGSFHTYGIIWSPGMMQFYVDDPANVYLVHDAADIPEGGTWVFDHPFYLVMSLGEGGEWAGDSDATTPNPPDMLVDYVRAYRIPKVIAPTIRWQPVQVKAGSAMVSTVSLRAPAYAGRVRLACTTDSPAVPCSLATRVLDFSGTLSQEDALTISTDSFSEKGHLTAPSGRYHLTITATTISGDLSQQTIPFDVTGN